MARSDIDGPMYYAKDYDYSLYYQNEFPDYGDLPDPHRAQANKPVTLPTINYLNERKCPIYIHHLRTDSSIYNNYGQKLTTPRKNPDGPKVTPQHASKFVLDKLEETYWATWKPKKDNLPVNKRSPGKVLGLGLSDVKPVFRVHNKGSKKASNKPHGDVNDNIIKYFRGKDFMSSSTAGSVAQEETNRKSTRASSTATSTLQDESGKTSSSSTITASVINEVSQAKKSLRRMTRPLKYGKVTQKDSVSQEIQTEVHCPVILEQTKQDIGDGKNLQVIFEREEETAEEKVESGEDATGVSTNTENEKETNIKQEEKSKPDGKTKKNKKPKKNKKKDLQEKPNLTETEAISDSTNTFLDVKDSIEVAKEKQERSVSKEHYQQPKCIRLYRKSGTASGYIKGGTYPLKSCLKKDGFPKGNFRLGAPGSPLFITTSSFSSKRRK